jgi:putative tricarboxylic transport membrane protein
MSDRIAGVVLLVFALVFGGLALSIEVPLAYEPVGPKAFPLIVLSVIALAAVYIFARPDAEPEWPTRPVALRAAGIIAALVAYVFLLQPIGFLAATVACVFAIAVLFGGSWREGLLGGFGIAGGVYVAFVYLLDFRLPGGSLWGF